MKQPHIVLDTNVLISAILFAGKPRAILDEIYRGNVCCSLSPVILDELQGILQRPKFGFSRDAAFQIMEELQLICSVVFPRLKLTVVHADPDDNRVLECALEAQADAIVSGDSHLLDIGEFKQIRIMSPAVFWQSFKNS